MRSFLSLVFAVVTASSTLACTANVGNCEVDPAADCFIGKQSTGTGGVGGTGTTSGGGGTGTGPKCVVADCPKDDCNDAVCVADACALAPKPVDTDCGDGLKCDANGACKCTGDTEQSCPSDQCNAPKCKGGLCAMEPTVGAVCEEPAGVPGLCDATGSCATCSDGVKNGGETDVDCGSPECGNCDGSACGNVADCKSNQCVDGVCCNLACTGKCEACTKAITGGEDGVCAAILVGNNDANFSDCDAKGGCGVDNLCRCEDGVHSDGETDVDCGGACGENCTRGQKCTSKNDCLGMSDCTDGTCCATQCNEECKRCDLPGTEGLCTAMPGADAGKCENTDQCSVVATCGNAVGQDCGDDPECATGLCMAGKCAACAAGNACPNATDVCVDGYCTAPRTSGKPCIDNAMCVSGFCVDGVCCDVACGGACMACQTNYTGLTSGVCAPLLSTYDPHDECKGVGKAATCSGAAPDGDGNSPCGVN